jgi:hypothetical protein
VTPPIKAMFMKWVVSLHDVPWFGEKQPAAA